VSEEWAANISGQRSMATKPLPETSGADVYNKLYDFFEKHRDTLEVRGGIVSLMPSRYDGAVDIDLNELALWILDQGKSPWPDGQLQSLLRGVRRSKAFR
jgi:hypothetical protein